jgi:hypothetical protein
MMAAETTVSEPLRALAVRSLSLLLYERARHHTVLAAIGGGGLATGGTGGILSSLLHKSIASFMAAGAPLSAINAAPQVSPVSGAGPSTPSLPPGTQPMPTGGLGPITSPHTAHNIHAPPGGPISVEFMDSVMQLMGFLVQSSSGQTGLSDAGAMQALLPLLGDKWYVRGGQGLTWSRGWNGGSVAGKQLGDGWQCGRSLLCQGTEETLQLWGLVRVTGMALGDAAATFASCVVEYSAVQAHPNCIPMRYELNAEQSVVQPGC